MKIIADESMPLVKELFSQYGKIVKCEGRGISADKLKDADVLLVRSITKITKELLEDYSVSFVGTATIGLDHMDTNWLEQQNITYANAPGCNAIAVAEYVLSGLFVMAEKYSIDLRTSKVGIIGAGNVGSAVAHRLDILGIPYGLFDPPLKAAGDKRAMINKKELEECEFITIHVPFTTSDESQWPTDSMVDKRFFNKMQRMKYLINTARGHVVDGSALKDWLNSNEQHQAILDVWENEPFIDKELVEKCILSTPHIAGHTREGKLRGTLMLYHAFCKHFDFEDTLDDDEQLTRDLPKDKIHLFPEQSFMEAMSSAIWSAYDIRDDDKALRGGLSKNIPKHFDRLRKGYKVRREFTAHRLDPVSLPDGSRRTLIELGFKTSNVQDSRN